MISAYRIVKDKHAKSAFDGEGARLYGGRWTSKGMRAVYVSSTIALATLEVIVHSKSVGLLRAYSIFKIEIPKKLINKISHALPNNWREYPSPASLKVIGDNWLIHKRSAVLEIPSAIVGVESNYLINPDHVDFHQIAIGPKEKYVLDRRLLTKVKIKKKI